MRNIGSRAYWATIPHGFQQAQYGERAPPRITEDGAAGRATDRQIFEGAGHLITVKRASGQANADAVLADDRRRHQGRLLVPVRSDV
jgi:hypothetical protein